MERVKLLALCVLAALCTIAPVQAKIISPVIDGVFEIDLISPSQVAWTPSLNNGYNSTWYEYPQTSGGTWWNQWWYNGSYAATGGTWVQLDFYYQLINPDLDGAFCVTFNWSTDEWVGYTEPPTWLTSTDPEAYLERLTDYSVTWCFDIPAYSPGDYWSSGVYWLPISYNPEWISADLRGENIRIPEPATLLLLGCGLAALRAKGKKVI